MERITHLYKTLTGCEPKDIVPLAGAGSNRRYFRVEGGEEHSDGKTRTLIAVIGTHLEENEAFLTLASQFSHGGLSVPEVLAVSEDRMTYLLEDCGDVSLYSFMAQHRQENGEFDQEALAALQATIEALPQIQFLPVSSKTEESFFSKCFPQQTMDRHNVMFDLNYFKYCFLKLKGIEFNEFKLQQDFENLADDLLKEQDTTFLYRDFQSRNVMLKDGKPYFIDFQGGRRGPIYYDVASFLWQSSARFSDDIRSILIDSYLRALRPYRIVEKSDFISKLHLFVFFRVLQVLGAYGYRGLWEKKAYFIESIPLAISNLQKELLLGVCAPYPYLQEVCATLVTLCTQDEEARREEEEKRAKVAAYLQHDATYLNTENRPPLVVRVFSFSFKKGIPEDESGNGGGYVFDCRSTHNPGRYDEYKPLTGLDQPVIDFLEADGEILTFLDSVYKMVDFHVARFMERGFANLQINFGCTGGRHRSVYSAQHVAEHIHQKFGVEVRINHREQGVKQTLSIRP